MFSRFLRRTKGRAVFDSICIRVQYKPKSTAHFSSLLYQWLRDHHVVPVAYGEGVGTRLRIASDNHLDAFIDTFGADYVELALRPGVRPERLDTIINFEAVEKYGIKAEGNTAGASAEVLAKLAQCIARQELEIPIARVYPLANVRGAYRELEQRHTLGKIVLVP